MIFYPHLEHALAILIEASIKTRAELRAPWTTSSPKAFLDQFCTIRMSSSRRAGHSTAIIRMAATLFDNPIITAPSVSIVRHVEREAEATLGTRQSKITFLPIVNFRSQRGKECDAIFVDCAFLMSAKDTREVEELALSSLSNRNFCLVYVQ